MAEMLSKVDDLDSVSASRGTVDRAEKALLPGRLFVTRPGDHSARSNPMAVTPPWNAHRHRPNEASNGREY